MNKAFHSLAIVVAVTFVGCRDREVVGRVEVLEAQVTEQKLKIEQLETAKLNDKIDAIYADQMRIRSAISNIVNIDDQIGSKNTTALSNLLAWNQQLTEDVNVLKTNFIVQQKQSQLQDGYIQSIYAHLKELNNRR